MASGRWREPFSTRCWAFGRTSSSISIEHQLAHAVRDPNGRVYNRTAFLPERHRMMQAWADYLDRLRAGNDPSGPAEVTRPMPAAEIDPRSGLRVF